MRHVVLATLTSLSLLASELTFNFSHIAICSKFAAVVSVWMGRSFLPSLKFCDVSTEDDDFCRSL